MPARCRHSDLSTLTRFILTEQKKHPGATGELSLILSAIQVRPLPSAGPKPPRSNACVLAPPPPPLQTACKAITSAVRRVGLTGLYGMHGSVNSTGDDVKKLDVLSNDIWINTLRHTHLVSIIASVRSMPVS